MPIAVEVEVKTLNGTMILAEDELSRPYAADLSSSAMQ